MDKVADGMAEKVKGLWSADKAPDRQTPIWKALREAVDGILKPPATSRRATRSGGGVA